MGKVIDFPQQHQGAPLLALATLELAAADTIIAVMRQSMTPEQKEDCAKSLAALGLATEGVTRANEREAALRALGVDVTTPAHKRQFD